MIKRVIACHLHTILRSSITFIFLQLFFVGVYAENRYTQITNASGLSNSAINCICQDSSKTIWVGTWDGLNSFNGKDFKVYTPNYQNTKTISNNIIRNIIEQTRGIIWIATDHGINRMDVHNSSFTHFYFGYEKIYPALPEIYSIAKSSDNTIFCAVYEWGLSFYKESTQEFHTINSPFIKTQDIKDIKIDAKDNLWLLHKNGEIDILEWSKDKKGNVIIQSSSKVDLPTISSLYCDNNYITALDKNKNIYVFDTLAENKQIFEYNLNNIVRHGGLNKICIIDEVLYIAPSTGSYFTLPMTTDGKPTFNEELDGIKVNSFYQSDQKILWVGTDGSGIYMIYNKNQIFNAVQIKKEMRMVRSFCEDNQKNLWIATKGGGIAMLHKSEDTQYQIVSEYNTGNGLLNNDAYTIQKGFGGDLFIGTDGQGINVFSKGKLSAIDLTNITPSLRGSKMFSGTYAIYCSEKDSTLWLGTSEYGLIKLKIQKHHESYKAISCKQYLHQKDTPDCLTNNVIYTIVPDNENFLWIGTRGGGLNYFDIKNEKFTSYQQIPQNTESLSSNDVLSLYIEPNGDLWIGTSAGLNLLKKEHRESGQFIRYDYTTNLPNNTVHGIIDDDKGNIWVSTNKGIAQINKSNNQITSYYQRNGLQNDEFSDGAYYKSEFDNHVFFGGISGFNVFNPDVISLSNYVPNFQISSFKIFNTEINIHERIVRNKKGVEELILNYDQNFISINFLSMDFIQNENCEYKYLLEGVDKDWIFNGNHGYATYANLKPGKYKLNIYYTNSDKVWMEKPYLLQITITPPYWQTTTAYCIYFIIACIAIFLIYYLIKRRFNQKRKLLIEKLEKQELKNIHEAKLRFFTNIAHEFYTPITLIYGPCERLLDYDNSDDYIKKYVKIIQSNAERMKHLISELMEFRKIDTELLTIHPQKINITQLTKEINSKFQEILEENNIDFTVNAPEEDIYWISDESAVEKVLFNIISNAFKYTPQYGYIKINIEVQNNTLLFQITNSGKGIKQENISRIFDRFKVLSDFENQIEKGNIGRNGIGLALTKSLVNLLKGEIKVESQPGDYTTFSIELPQLEEMESSSSTEVEEPTPVDSLASQEIIHLQTRNDSSPIILIVDDEKDIRTLIYDTLSAKYPNIIQASNGKEALNLMKTKRPNLIISDIIMPEMSGLELAKELKNNIFTNHIPIIFLTAKTSIEDQILAEESGSDTYLTKPFHPKHILAKVDNIIGKYKQLQEYYLSSATSYELLDNGSLIHNEDKEFFKAIIDFIEKNIEDEDLSAPKICDEMGISKMSFYRKTKKVLNLTPSDFIKNIKLNRAGSLLKTTNFTVQEIIYRCGFNNRSYFYREFLKSYNMTPKEYRDKYKIKGESDDISSGGHSE